MDVVAVLRLERDVVGNRTVALLRVRVHEQVLRFFALLKIVGAKLLQKFINRHRSAFFFRAAQRRNNQDEENTTAHGPLHLYDESDSVRLHLF